MKRPIWAACLLILLPLATPAQEPARCVWLGPPTLADGQYTIPLLIDNIDEIIAADIYVLFDSEQITLVDVRRADLLAGFLFLSNPVQDTLKIAFANTLANTGEGVFAEILVADTGIVPELHLLMVSFNGDQIPAKYDTPTDVLQIHGLQPTTPHLAPNYPNPFNAQTTIPYSLSEQTQARLEIFNMMGQRVRTLVDEEQQPGSYLALWDGRSNTGGELASGVYFYRLQAGTFDQMRRMTLLK